MYKVSIVFPVYNVEKFVEVSLKSALSQDYDSIEYVIVNDCATDGSMDIIAEVLSHSPRKQDVFIISHNKNQGLSAARNTGLDNSKGDYVFFMDSDDEISEDCISKHVAALERENADFTVANFNLVGSKSVHIHNIPKDVGNKKVIDTFFERAWSVSACNKLYKKIFLKVNNIHFVNGMQHEDYIWSFKIACHAYRLAYVEKATYDYKIRNNSITTAVYRDLKISSMLYVLNTISNAEESKTKLGHQFLNFVKMNTALYILNYQGNNTRASYYNQLKRIDTRLDPHNKFGYLLKMPYPLFFLFMKPLYTLYKTLQ